jgi:hypothetical protein
MEGDLLPSTLLLDLELRINHYTFFYHNKSLTYAYKLSQTTSFFFLMLWKTDLP